ncbi:MAG: DUF4388 domain-containing protein [Myxococcales bacterium]|nr:DUF4388 domain-containing protein [Myxococcales bacterium]
MRGGKAPEFEVIEGGQSDAEGPFSVADYVQLAGLGGHSVVVSVEAGFEARGEIVVREGRVWWARDAQGEGEEAFRRLIIAGDLKRKAPARCRPLGAVPVPRNIQSSLESLLLDTARTWDEDSRDIPPVSTHDQELARDHFEAFFEEGIDALLRKSYSEAYAAFATAAELRPQDHLVQTNLQRLRDLGYGG